MKTTSIHTLLIASIFLMVGCTSKNNKSNSANELIGQEETKEFTLSEDYDKLNTAIPCDIIYEQKDEPAHIHVEGDAYIISLLKVEVVNGALQISLQKDIEPLNEYKETKIYTSSKQLAMAIIAGSSEVHLKGTIKGQSLDIRSNSSSDIIADDLQYQAVAASLNGSGDVKIKGKTTAATYTLNGSGDIEAEEFKVDNLQIYLFGSGDANVNVNKSLYVVSNGTGDIKYTGKPKKVDSKINGNGTVTPQSK